MLFPERVFLNPRPDVFLSLACMHIQSVDFALNERGQIFNENCLPNSRLAHYNQRDPSHHSQKDDGHLDYVVLGEQSH